MRATEKNCKILYFSHAMDAASISGVEAYIINCIKNFDRVHVDVMYQGTPNPVLQKLFKEYKMNNYLMSSDPSLLARLM